MTDVLFLLKRREDFDSVVHNKLGLSTGLYNSANYAHEMLLTNNIKSEIVVVIDNNDIDREVTKYRPKFCVIEALWVVPSKFTILQKLHPTVTWIIRLHSEMPFMANEGMAMDWLGDYSDFSNIIISCNAPRMLSEVSSYLKIRNKWTQEQTNNRVIYLPNYYPVEYKTKIFDYMNDTINISCFGAIRPLKNHLVQAHAALQFANKINKKLRFHVNAGRVENNGGPVLNNLRGLFQQLAPVGHEMVNHLWSVKDEFLQLCASMDIALQVSFSETFNIVGADHVSQGVPLVGSSEIPWLDQKYAANPVNTNDIVNKLLTAYQDPNRNVADNQATLAAYSNQIPFIWDQFLKL